MRRYLVIANETLAGSHLTDAVTEALRAGPSSFHIVVPASHRGHATWTEGEATALARRRLDAGLEAFRRLGAEVTGEVGDPSPVAAARDALRHAHYDEVIVSTLPPGPSRWLHQDAVNRIRKQTPVPVRHIVGAPEVAPAR